MLSVDCYSSKKGGMEGVYDCSMLATIFGDYAGWPQGLGFKYWPLILLTDAKLVSLVRFFFRQRRAVGGVDFFLDGCPAIVLLINRTSKMNEGIVKAFLPFLIPNVIFYLPEVLIDLFEALDERGVHVELEIVQFGFQSFQFFFDVF